MCKVLRPNSTDVRCCIFDVPWQNEIQSGLYFRTIPSRWFRQRRQFHSISLARNSESNQETC